MISKNIIIIKNNIFNLRRNKINNHYSILSIIAIFAGLILFPVRSESEIVIQKKIIEHDSVNLKKECLIDGSIPKEETEIRPVQAAAFGVLGLGTLIYINSQMNERWWSIHNHPDFRIKNDWDETLHIDKYGHFAATYILSDIACEGLMYSGVSRRWSEAIGALFGLSYELYIEINDGYASPYGFSPSDAFADLLGMGFFLAGKNISALKCFTPKWMYIPPNWLNTGVPESVISFFDTYNSSSFWLSIDVSGLLPAEGESYFPKWLNLALGYSVRGFENNGLYRNFMISADLNMEKLTDGMKPSALKWLLRKVNFIKLPSPTIEFGRVTNVYLFYPFQLNLFFQF